MYVHRGALHLSESNVRLGTTRQVIHSISTGYLYQKSIMPVPAIKTPSPSDDHTKILACFLYNARGLDCLSA